MCRGGGGGVCAGGAGRVLHGDMCWVVLVPTGWPCVLGTGAGGGGLLLASCAGPSRVKIRTVISYPYYIKFMNCLSSFKFGTESSQEPFRSNLVYRETV